MAPQDQPSKFSPPTDSTLSHMFDQTRHVSNSTLNRKFGPSLSYLNATGTGGASNATVLADTVVPSSFDWYIMSDVPCQGASCGFVRPGSVAYRKCPSLTLSSYLVS